MIQSVQELSASLRYASEWADTLESLRRHSQETDASLLPVTSAGPLAEIRRVMLEAREFVEELAQEAAPDYRLPTQDQKQQSQKQKVA